MAWIESHQNLGDHPKTLRAASMLRISPAEMVGHLHFLWWWALDYAQSGDISALTPSEIAHAARWMRDGAHKNRNPEVFVDALITCGPHGFLDRVDGHLQIHDWMEYAGKLIERRRKDAARKRGNPADIHGKSSGAPPQPALEGARTQQYQPTNQPNQPAVAPDLLLPVLSAWEDATGQLAPRMTADGMDHWIEKASQQWVLDAIVEMNANGVKSWKYVVTILERWMRDGRDVVKATVNGNGPKPYELPEPWRDHVVLSAEEQERNAEETRASLVEYKARKAASRE